ncbi:hypothetical protein ACJ73_06523 [Blastomyces percursus]|uniref:BRCT domain-containing protein n=1 Tax=Blastomyces percursus TaxID=1658174 RepID=A0A1J9R0X8_9EURO|nr:hypothetical protein ACJ73_06523 [Blastomyces percursus]
MSRSNYLFGISNKLQFNYDYAGIEPPGNGFTVGSAGLRTLLHASLYASTMESQDDSLDLDYLKQAALGLTDEQSTLDVSRNLQLRGFRRFIPTRGDGFSSLNIATRQPLQPDVEQSSVPESPTKMATVSGSLPGDTQPISQSVFESFMSKASSNREHSKHQEGEEGDDNSTARDATLHEGDTGHLDLLAAFGETPGANREFIDDNGRPENLDMVGGIPSPTQHQHFPESQRFITRTPASQNRRNSHPEVSTTPILPRYPFNSEHSGSTVMALSQVFNATQNPSSPFTNGPPLSSDMPSPNLPIEPRLTGTTTVFSPLLPSPVHPSKHLEPQANYVSMKQSQAVREILARLHSTGENGSSDDDFEKDDSYVRRHVRGKYTEEKVKRQFANVTAPARSNSKGHGKTVTADQSSPAPAESRSSRSHRAALSTVERNNAGNSEEETEQEDELEVSHSRRLLHSQLSGEDDKENVDSGPVLVADTTTSAHDALSQALELYSAAGHRNLIREVSGLSNDSQEVASHPQGSLSESENTTPSGSQIVNIANSQPLSDHGPKRRRGRSRKVVAHLTQSPSEGCIPSPVSGSRSQRGFPPSSHVFNHGSKRLRGRPRSRKQDMHLAQSLGEECVPSSPTFGPHERSSFPEQTSRMGHPTLKTTSRTQRNPENASPLETPHKTSYQRSQPVDQGAPDMASSNDQNEYPEAAKSKTTYTNASAEEIAGPMKASSMPSRVLETPTQNEKPSKPNHQTISESSSLSPFSKSITRFNNKSPTSPTHDDDELPVVPQFSRYQVGRLEAPGLLPRGGTHHTISAVLSSPSGRQRRSMTEIAAEQSPCHSLPDFLSDFGLITAEDKEFAFITREVGLPANKRRRGNDRVITSSNPFDRDQTPTPQETPTLLQSAANVSESMNNVSEPTTPIPVQHAQRNSILIHQNPKTHAKKAASVWEVECSPVQPKKEDRRGRKRRLSQPLSRAISKARTSQQLRNSIAWPIEERKSKSPSPTPTQLIDRADSPDPIQGEETHTRSTLGSVSPSSNSPTFTNKVFAFFNGRPQGYFPATCVGISHSAGGIRYLVRFEDSIKPDEVNADAVKRLELRKNDVVKVDLLQVPKIPHAVVGFQKSYEATAFRDGKRTLSSTITDVHGHHSVILRPRGPNGSFRNGPDITVPISNVYLDRILWTRLENRQYLYLPQLLNAPGSGLQTPLDHRPSSAYSVSRTSHRFPSASGLFFGMAFAVSYKDNEEKRLRIEELITQNGGRILKDGFTELFNQPLSNLPSTSFENNSAVTSSADDDDKLLSLHPTAEATGFVCLLTDEHTRRVKYMQALALNIPCLAGRWIHDCVAKDQIVDWEPYLLPAGESTFLNGAIRSRAIAPNPALTARLPDTIAARPKLLAGQSVLLVMDRGKIAEQRKPYSFLTCALGPNRIARVPDMDAALKLLAPREGESPTSRAYSDVGWDWIYVGDEKAAVAARTQLIQASQAGLTKVTSRAHSRGRPPKKRQGRGRPAKGAARVAATSADLASGTIGGSDVSVNGRTVRILDNEYICQSLILGKLFEP